METFLNEQQRELLDLLYLRVGELKKNPDVRWEYAEIRFDLHIAGERKVVGWTWRRGDAEPESLLIL